MHFSKVIISIFLVSRPHILQNRGEHEVIIDYLLCQYAKVKCGIIAYSNAFYSL